MREQDAERQAAGRAPVVRNWDQRTNLTAAERDKAVRSVGTVTYLDYQYRLRIRSNYEDSTMFTDGWENDTQSTLVRSSISYLTSACLLVSEMLIKDLVGRSKMAKERDGELGQREHSECNPR
jgi:hypothetical protein